jgi:hypothetical protein
VWEREVYRGRVVGGIGSESSESDPEEGFKANGSWSSSCKLSSTEAGSEGDVFGTGERGLVIAWLTGRGGYSLVVVSRDRRVGRLGVDLDWNPEGTAFPRL